MLSVHIEDLDAEALEEAKPLLPGHYDELSEHKAAGIPLDPQYGLYLARAAAGQVLYVTLRDRGELIGYLVSFIAPGMHYKSCLTATADIFFVKQDHRGFEGGKMLFRAWLKECKRRGVALTQIGMKIRHAVHARRVLEACGFEETEIMFWQFIEKDEP